MVAKSVCNSFIRIKFGGDEEKLFNPDCTMQLLIDNIREKCDCPPLDLAVAREKKNIVSGDTTVTVAELPENMDNGRPYFEDRGSYVLLTVLRRDGRNSEYDSLLDADYMSQDLKDKLHSLNNPKAVIERRSKISKVRPPQKRELGSRGSKRASIAVAAIRGK